ncbi:MAG: glutathione peroxidase [Hyphomicrobiales bacterium]|nr:glutathione peroxidase [Hyphomicrobiales bacterium]
MIDRRTVLGAGLAMMAAAGAEASAHAYSFDGIEGGAIKLVDSRGKLLMVVNTASRCGFTGQYAGLQTLWTRYRSRGLTIIGVPSNDFAGQEPGSNEEILGFCSQRFGVTFPLAAKTTVIGEDAHPFYRWAARERPSDTPRWNFHKYLIGRDGGLKAGFTSATEPSDPAIIVAIETELGRT